MKKYSLLGKGLKRDFFYRLEKNNTTPPKQNKNYPPKKKSPVQSPVQIFQLAIYFDGEELFLYRSEKYFTT